MTESTQSNRKQKFKKYSPVLAGLFVFAVMFAFGVYRCPLQFFFGIPCALCGITRAFMSLAKGDVAGAFFYHPLWPLAPVVALFFALTYLEIIHPSKRVYNAVVYTSAALLLICFIIRHIMHSPVVEIDLASSFLGKAVTHFEGLW